MNERTHHTLAHKERVTLFANVLLPVPVARYFTYRVPYDWNVSIQQGVRVIVQFGPKKILTGIVMEVHDRPPREHEAKYILEILDDQPVVTLPQLATMKWMAGYYMCTEGQVLQVALPSGLKLSSQSKIQLHPSFDRSRIAVPLSEEESAILSLLQQEEIINYSDIQEKLGIKNVHKLVKSLLFKNLVLLFEEVREKYQPKKETRIRLTEEFTSKEALEALFEALQKKPKQTDILLRYLQLVPIFEDKALNQTGVAKSQMSAPNLSPSSLQTLTRKNVFETYEVVVSRFAEYETEKHKINLTRSQSGVRDAIIQAFEKSETVLLHGITGSGKTEIYVDLIQKVLSSGSQVLYLLPEIALTTQIVSRLQKIFGNTMGVYHSRFSDNERVEVWRGVLQDRFSLVVGVRSAVLLPFDNLGLVIVDEEHELSYKQFDPAPRYHARDVALVLARRHHAKTLLGSATPSVESYFNASQGKYELVSLQERYLKAALPSYQIIDTGTAQLKKKMQGVFSLELLEALSRVLEQKKQAIIFQNRRGYAPYLQCETCGFIPQCPQCSVSLTYHMHYNQLRCHYCGHKEKMPSFCNSCNSTHQELKGYGTEKLEEDIKELFPQAKVQRMDLDTTRRKYSYQQIIDAFEGGEIDILIGTQMVSKGLDFDNVDLVGVLDVDRIIHYPDFRSFERAFQLITQVGGRAGRRSGQGQVLIQTKNPRHPLLGLIVSHDYETFYQTELRERSKFRYPPFIRIIRLTFKSPERELSARAATELSHILKEGLGSERILGPQEPLISKIRNQYLMELYIKLEKSPGTIKKIKKRLTQETEKMTRSKPYRAVRIIADVDPY